MGLDAQLIAVGPYSEAVLPALEYEAQFYVGVSPGQIVITNVFLACTSEASHALAAAFCVGAMELGKHEFCPGNANFKVLEAEFGAHNLDQFKLLAEHGFRFFYLPNG